MKVVYLLVAFLINNQIFGLNILPPVSASETVTPAPASSILVNNFCNNFIKNQTTVKVNSGENSASENTGNGFVSSGNAVLLSLASNDICSSDLEINSSPDYFFGSEEIRQHRIHVLNNNNAEIGSQIITKVNTGENSALKNTGDIFILTGNASQISHLSNQAGVSNIEIISPSNYNIDSGEIKKHKIKILESNNAKVKNLNKEISNTGGNQADLSSGLSGTLTGNSSLEIFSDTFLNSSHLNLYSP